MISDHQFRKTVEKIIEQDQRYDIEAYAFINAAVRHTAGKLPKDRRTRNISGRQLLEGVGEFAVEQFGPFALEVLRSWGLNNCRDIGRVVFNMVDHKLLAKSRDDSIDDFNSGLDFDQVFQAPFRPAAESPRSKQVIA